ncbi:MAG TPA: hypothetical protein VHR66_27780 [Gemmataceae bacterium]|jgi:hypothetical protein|nr:hypothetical protein [Gemmataceae bacterium]
MFADILQELSGRGMSVVLGLIIGGLITFLFARWKRFRERRSVLTGDARDTVVIHQHVVESEEGPNGRVPTVVRVRSVGQAEVDRVVPNGHLASILLHRAHNVTPRDTLISMEGCEGSFLLETLTNFVCDRVTNAPFDHELYVMAPCCEPAMMSVHQPIVIVLIRKSDLVLFEDWTLCRNVRVEHGSDGARVLTLMEMAKRFREEQNKIASLRTSGQRTTHVETMYMLDLALDNRIADIPTKPVPWGRFERVLERMNLE